MARALNLSAEVIGINGHIDTLQRALVVGEVLGKQLGLGHVDIPGLHEGRYAVEEIQIQRNLQ